MKIDPTLKTLAPTPVAEDRTRSQKQAEEPAVKPRGEVQVSSLSSKLREIEAGLGKEKTVDTQRVAEIKKAIDEGRFEVNSHAVADRLIDNTRDFLRAHKQ
ncbi:MAG: flgM [Betaproteobacteria bacterium]|jgi:negative regulator of flagellin synthesis FlgM|nr:flgM [Betaproteobacteria bacterium]